MAEKEVKSRKLKIVIADDVANMRKTLKSMLHSLGYRSVLEANDGDSALAQIRTNPTDIVVCDWNMPRMSGVELLTEVRDDPRMRDMPFIMITAESDEAQIVRAAEEDVDGYLIKPFVANTLEKKISSVLEKRANPPPVEVHLRMALVYVDNGMFSDALAELDRARGLLPESARIELAYSKVYERKGDAKQAEKAIRSAMVLNPRYLKAYNYMAEMQVKAGDESGALETLTSAARLSPNNPKRLVTLGKIQLKHGRMEEAKKTFSNAMANLTHDKGVHAEIGEAYLANGQEDLAIEAFGKSLEIAKDVRVYNRLGIALRRKKQFKEAVDNYERALELDPNDEVLHYNKGLALMEDGRIPAATEEFKLALEIDPDFAECKEALKNAGRDSYGGQGADGYLGKTNEGGGGALPWDDSSKSSDPYDMYGSLRSD